MLLTVDPTLLKWRSLPAKKREILKSLNKGKDANFTKIDVEYRPDLSKPQLKSDALINHNWLDGHMKPYFEKGYDFVGLHFSNKQWTAAKLKSTTRGANPIDSDLIGEFYLRADEDTKFRYARGKRKKVQFVQTLVHEICHEYYRGAKLGDDTHDHHYTEGEIKTLADDFDWSLYRPDLTVYRKKKSLLLLLVELLTKFLSLRANIQTPAFRLPQEYKEKISQLYGVPNSLYKLTGHHIGVDYATPVGTPVYAPMPGEVTVVGTTPTLGNYCHYEYMYQGKKHVERYLHLQKVPKLIKANRGQIVAYTGNTGQSTGPHIHIDGHWDEVKIDEMTPTSWKLLTYDPDYIYGK